MKGKMLKEWEQFLLTGHQDLILHNHWSLFVISCNFLLCLKPFERINIRNLVKPVDRTCLIFHNQA